MTIQDFRVATANAAHTQEQLAEYFRYELETGKLFWKIDKNKARAGDEDYIRTLRIMENKYEATLSHKLR